MRSSDVRAFALGRGKDLCRTYSARGWSSTLSQPLRVGFTCDAPTALAGRCRWVRVEASRIDEESLDFGRAFVG